MSAEEKWLAEARSCGANVTDYVNYAFEDKVAVFSAEALDRFAALVRDQALEDAALVCDKRIAYWMEGDLRRVEDESCARLIRALKASPDAKG